MIRVLQQLDRMAQVSIGGAYTLHTSSLVAVSILLYIQSYYSIEPIKTNIYIQNK